MTIRTALACMGIVIGSMLLAGCGDNTEVDKAKNDAYHAKDAGPRPPAGAMQSKGPAVGPFAGSGGIPPGTTAAAAGAKGMPAGTGK